MCNTLPCVIIMQCPATLIGILLAGCNSILKGQAAVYYMYVDAVHVYPYVYTCTIHMYVDAVHVYPYVYTCTIHMYVDAVHVYTCTIHM